MKLGKVSLFWLCALPAAFGQTVNSSISFSGTGAGFGQVEATATAEYPGNCTGTDGEGSATYGTISVTVPQEPNEGCTTVTQDEPSIGCYSDGFVSPGTYIVTASYSGVSGNDCGVNGSSGSTTVVVPYGSTMMQIYDESSTTLQAGQAFSLELLFTSEDAEIYQYFPYPSGNVQLVEGGHAVLSAPLGSPDDDGEESSFFPTITASTKGLPPGNYSVYAKYPGDANYSSSQISPFTVTLLPAQMATTTKLTVSPNPTIEGGATVFTATVTPAGVTIPSGKVTLLAGSTTVGTITLSNGTGTISFPADIAPGKYSVQAIYGGDTYNVASTSSPVSVTVDAQTSTTTAVSLSPSTIVAGASALLTVTVNPAISNVVPTGTVTVTANGTAIAALPLSNGKASEELSTSGLAPGSYAIVGKYSGSSLATASTSPTVTVTISPASAVMLTAAPNPVAQGSVTTLTATVKNGSGGLVTSGTVAFKYGSSVLGTANVGSNGQATLPIGTSSFADGNYTITANFSGSGSVPAATGTVSLVVN